MKPTTKRLWPHCLAIGTLCWVIPTLPADAQASHEGNKVEEHKAYLWRSVAIGGGGFITGYDADVSGDSRVVRTDVYGSYFWLSDEQRWTQLVTKSTMPAELQVQDGANEGVYEIAVAPSDHQRIYMALKGAVYRSTNQGRQFEKTAVPSETFGDFDPNSEFRNYGPFMAVDPSDPNVVLFGTPASGLWRTADGGLHWERITSVPPPMDLRSGTGIQSPGVIVWFTPWDASATADIWAMSSGHGIFVSKDRGKTFSKLGRPDSPQPASIKQGVFTKSGLFFGVDPESQSIWRHRAGEWTNLTSNGRIPKRRFGAIVGEVNPNELLVFDEGGQTYRSTEDGDRWQLMPHSSAVGVRDPLYLRVSNQSYFAISRVQKDPTVRGRVWVGAGTGVYFADIAPSDSRITWISQTRGIEELVANDVIAPLNGSPVFAAWDFGIHRKEDLTAFSNTYGPKERVVISAQQLAWTPSDPSFIVTNASDARTDCCSEDGDAVLAGYSNDGGRTWKKFARLPQPPGTSPNDPWRMSFGTIAVAADNAKNIIWVPTFDRSPYFTRDLGASWQRVSLSGERLPLTGSHSALHFHRKTLAADRVLPGVFYWMHSGGGLNEGLKGLWMTKDGGGAWEKVHDGEIAPLSQYSAKLRAVPGHAGHLFFTSGVGSATGTPLKRTFDGGRTWLQVAGLSQVDDIAFGKSAARSHYPAIYLSGRILGEYGIWRSDDNTVTWVRIAQFPVGSLDQVTVVEGDPNIFGRVYVGYKGSGWMVGGISGCNSAPPSFGATSECVASTPPIKVR